MALKVVVILPGHLKYEVGIVNHYTAFAKRSIKNIPMDFHQF
jgi:hypothetical protein